MIDVTRSADGRKSSSRSSSLSHTRMNRTIVTKKFLIIDIIILFFASSKTAIGSRTNSKRWTIKGVNSWASSHSRWRTPNDLNIFFNIWILWTVHDLLSDHQPQYLKQQAARHEANQHNNSARPEFHIFAEGKFELCVFVLCVCSVHEIIGIFGFKKKRRQPWTGAHFLMCCELLWSSLEERVWVGGGGGPSGQSEPAVGGKKVVIAMSLRSFFQT